MSRLAIMPARGGSKRIPAKNIKNFHGQPLISYALEAAKQAEVFDTIHVSTDDQMISDIVSGLGFAPDFGRPKTLAGDHTPIFDVLAYVVDTYRERGQNFDSVCLIYPTAPLIDPADLRDAAAQFETSNQDKILMAVSEFPCPVEWAYRRNAEDGALSPVQKGGFAKRSQDLDVAYYDAAMFAFFSSDFIQRYNGEALDEHCIGYPVARMRVTDIDTPADWSEAEILYKALHG